ncbi:MAG: hypothetical protein GVY24_07990 [Planctomycetes bacterium]|jgi:hypothetical protein|nr:hypothetical protein [Planctomycetota bacterium]
MGVIPPPSGDEAKKLGEVARHDEMDFDTSDESSEPASMTLSAIGKGGGDGPLGVDGFGESDDASGSDFSKITQHGAFVIVVVAVVAAVVLGAMRLTGGKLGATTDAKIEGLIDDTLIKLKNQQHLAAGDPLLEMGSHVMPTSTVIRTLTDHEPPQVPIEFVQKNPFVFGVKKPEPEKKVVTRPKVDHSARIKDQIRREIGKLQIDMIMAGTEEKAVVINGDIYKVGDTISIFRVESIEAQEVKLRHGKYRVPLRTGG